MSDWQPGDLALCIRDDACPIRNDACPYTKGRTYVVTDYREGRDDFGRPAAGIKTSFYSGHWWSVIAFKKVGRHIPDAEDRETIRLLNGKPVPVEA